MTTEEINKVFEKKNLIEVLGYTLVGLSMIIDDIPGSAQPEFDTNGESIDLRSLLVARDLVEKKLVEIADSPNNL